MRLLVLSSTVAFGHVGASAQAPALAALGLSATVLPTVVLSNHPGWSVAKGARMAPEMLRDMLDALETNGWLDQHDAMLTGYLPSAAHVALAVEAHGRLKRVRPDARLTVDPVLGDEPGGLYIEEAAAVAVRDQLVPLADLLTPNAFELSWLTGRSFSSASVAAEVASALGRPKLVLTSPPLGAGETGLLEVTPEQVQVFRQPVRDGVPHGVGDVLAGFLAAGVPTGAAAGLLHSLIERSLGANHLRIIERAAAWGAAPPVPGVAL